MFTHYDASDFQNLTDEPEEFRNVVGYMAENPQECSGLRPMVVDLSSSKIEASFYQLCTQSC